MGRTCGCKMMSGKMTAYEFACICRRWGVFDLETGYTCDIGDIYMLFDEEGGSVDFEGFLTLLGRVGDMLGMGEDFLVFLARDADKLDAKEANQKYPRVPPPITLEFNRTGSKGGSLGNSGNGGGPGGSRKHLPPLMSPSCRMSSLVVLG